MTQHTTRRGLFRQNSTFTKGTKDGVSNNVSKRGIVQVKLQKGSKIEAKTGAAMKSSFASRRHLSSAPSGTIRYIVRASHPP